MRRLVHLLVGTCVFSVLAVTTSVVPGATADEAAAPSASASASPTEGASPSTTPSATAGDTPTGTPAGEPTPTNPPSGQVSRSPAAVQQPLAPLAATTAPSPAVPLTAPTTKIISTPPAKSTSPKATFTFEADQAGVTFQCKLTGPGRTGTFAPCAVQPAAGSTTVPAIGSTTYTGLKAGSYTFTVHATPSLPAGSAPGPDAPFAWRVDDCTTKAVLCRVVTNNGASYTPTSGASFNNPLGSREANRRNLTRVIRIINSMPGYAVADPKLCAALPQLPGMIRISLYSVTDGAFARAMVAASNRCISVQILMNNHLSAENTGAIRIMQDALGASVYTGSGAVRRSFAHRCNYGCRGSGVLHSKFYLFHSNITMAGHSRIANTVLVGSSNMTGNASKVQWNDLYGARDNAKLFADYRSMFDRMRRDRNEALTVRFNTPPYRTTFWPQTPGGSDPTMSVLNSIRCQGANGGAGYHGRTVVYINIHAWFEARGLRLAERVRQMYNRGCYVRILYSFMSYTIYKELTAGTGPRMVARRTLFSTDGDKYADVYSHFKMIAASGVIGSDQSAWAVWTGSMNLTNDGTHFDEVMMRIAQRPAFAAYRDHWVAIRDRMSSAKWAMFLEPNGGGRAPLVPETKALRETAAFAVQSRETILAPDAIAGTPGDPQALD